MEQSESKLKVEGCDFGMGASDGLWLYHYNESTGFGYVGSMTFPWRLLDGVNRDPYFTDTVRTILDATAGD